MRPSSKGPHLLLRKPRRLGERRRWVIIDPHGSPRETSTGAFGDDRATAEKALAAYLAKKHVPQFGGGDPHEVLIADVLSLYGAQTTAIRQDTIGDAITMLLAFPQWAGRPVAAINAASCDDFVQWRIRQGKNGRMLKEPTARNDLLTLQAAINYAFEARKLKHPVPIKKPGPSQPRARWLTRSEAAALLAGALGWDCDGRRHHERINRHLARFILIGLYTGTRKDRVLRLQWVEGLTDGWVDLKRGMLHRKSLAEAETKKRAPSVPLSHRLWAHMRRWRRLTARYVIEHDGRNVTDLTAAWRSACELAGLATEPGDPIGVTPHTLRHTACSWLLAEGRTTFQVGKYVGMSATLVEKTYGHVNDALQRETANAFGRRRNIAGIVPRMSHR
jgi:integrase